MFLKLCKKIFVIKIYPKFQISPFLTSQKVKENKDNYNDMHFAFRTVYG